MIAVTTSTRPDGLCELGVYVHLHTPARHLLLPLIPPNTKNLPWCVRRQITLTDSKTDSAEINTDASLYSCELP